MPADHPLFILLISIHGLIRGEHLELGRDADTGGQTKYVVELARALARHDGIEQVDLITRRVVDTSVSSDYARPIEELADKARIVRLEAGPAAYIAKESLWPHLDTLADNVYEWMHNQTRLPDIIHTHYADAGYVGVRLSKATGIPLIHTGHSLGRDKWRRLMAMGTTIEQIEERYHMAERFSAEEDVLANAELIITSTRNEIEDQYGLYDYYAPEKMAVIPPGTDLKLFHPASKEDSPCQLAPTLNRLLKDSSKPMILALCRPDPRKNLLTLVEAYGESPSLQQLANLVVVAGNRDDIRDLSDSAQGMFAELLLAIDLHELYGLVALPKHHNSDDVPAIYRQAADSGGVFINPALTEPFGLTLLEAAACGLPLVATENGGPVDIIGNCRNGLLVDPLDKGAIASALKQLLTDQALWQRCASNGLRHVRTHYSWDAHASSYLQRIRPITDRHQARRAVPSPSRREIDRRRTLFTAIDNTLLGDVEALRKFIETVRRHRRQFVFGIATGRRLDSVLKLIRAYGIPSPDVLITSLGTEIHYSAQLFGDIAWSHHIDHVWTPKVLRRALEGIPGLKPQGKEEQSRYKLSYFYDAAEAPPLVEIQSILRQRELSVNAILSFGQYLDVIPARASKGQALRYVLNQRRIPLERSLVTGGSGGDEDMLRGNMLGVVVSNRHWEELSSLRDNERVYFAQGAHCRGILEAIEHYNFFSSRPQDSAPSS